MDKVRGHYTTFFKVLLSGVIHSVYKNKNKINKKKRIHTTELVPNCVLKESCTNECTKYKTTIPEQKKH